jgi:hypothetical protein
MIAETSFIETHPIQMLRHEAIDRLDSVVDDLPKYKEKFEELIAKFSIEALLELINAIYRDDEFKSSMYYRTYNNYFDEIEDLVHHLNI